MLTYGAPLILGGAAFWGLTAVDKMFLRNMSSFEELGTYSIAVSFAAAATILQSIFSTVWAPTVYKWASTGRDLGKVQEVTQYVLLVVLVLFCLAGTFSWMIDFLLPDSYSSVKYIMVSCLGYPLLYTLSETTVVGINVAKKTIYAMVASIIALIINLIGNYLLIPRFGAAGAAVSTSLAFWVFFFLRTEFSIKVWENIPRFRLYLSTLIMVSIASITTLYGSKLGNVLHLAWLVFLIVILVVFYREVRITVDFIKSKIKKVPVAT